MPYTVQPDTLGTMFKDLDRRLQALETGNQLGNSSIQQGALNILNAAGATVASFGELPDGDVGVGVDPAATGNMVEITKFTWGVSPQDYSPTLTTSSTSPVDLGYPDTDVVVGPGGQLLVVASTLVGIDGVAGGNTGSALVQVDGTTEGSCELATSGSDGIAASCSTIVYVPGLTQGHHTVSLRFQCSAASPCHFAQPALMALPLGE